ncbi:DUF2239 family protein [Paraglaciecola aquimarina]|uniref:DUF2239 family protein n=1 Tax=Paraglaciecola aquimarina TaxID=1235557 RepID=A0ABU3SWT7_9ALTE|nr:DUF2239 family protein [Paraglaciecola aquimarina]MDU0354475.1 DUF2239 family protein [Paraglaciecola aquimarina]
MDTQYLAIYQQKFLVKGKLQEVVQEVKAREQELGFAIEPIVIEVENCQRIDFSWHGNTQQVLANLPNAQPKQQAKRGRPKLGVKSKEVTLLPRHWEWLASQRGGASATLRRLVEEAQKNPSIEQQILLKQQQLDKFMLLFLADEQGYEEASRALYRNSRVGLESAIVTWPREIKDFVLDKFVEIAVLHNGAA